MDNNRCDCPEVDQEGRKEGHKPLFLITIDTEGDNIWSKPRKIMTRNAKFLPRFQELCEAYGFKPTYLVNYEMANCALFKEFGTDVLERQEGEMGMHLHAWNTPPFVSLTEDDFVWQPYLTEYPKNVMREKIARMTGILEDTFAVKMISHRAGRWGFNEIYANILVEQGYKVDCSVIPLISFERYPGNPKGNGGPDYSRFPNRAYFIDTMDISRPGDSPILEVPMTTIQSGGDLVHSLAAPTMNIPLVRKIINRIFPVMKLRPSGRNRKELVYIVKRSLGDNRNYLEFMLHSSELMPGGSPLFPKEKDVELLYDDIEVLFDLVQRTFVGATLNEYYKNFSQVNS